MDTLIEAVLTGTHDLCFVQKLETYQKLASENYPFYSREKSQYIAKVCYRNAKTMAYQPVH